MEAENRLKITPLSAAAFRGNIQIIGRLLDMGLKADMKNSENSTLLFPASFNGQLKVIEHIINKGAAVNVRNYGERINHHALTFTLFRVWQAFTR